MGLLISTVREFIKADRYVRSGLWQTQNYPLSVGSLRDRKVGIVGMGRIGQAIARRLDASLVPVVYHTRNPSKEVSYKHYPDLIEMAKAVDTLMVIVPGGASTNKMINAEVLKALGPRGVLVNVARGSVIDEPALVQALKSGTILAAGLDVFAAEPTVPDELKTMQERRAVAAYRLGLGGDTQRDGSARGRQPQILVRRQGAVDAGCGDAVQGTLMNALRLAAWVVAALVAASTLAQAQDTTTLKKEMVGQWELSTTERSKTCVVTMKGEAAGQGFKLELEPACKAALPFTKGIVAWSVRGLDIVRMQDASGEAVIDFTEVEAGIFEGLRQGEGVYILQDLAAARSMAKSMDQMIGDWSMVRSNGQPVCALTLTNTEAGPDNFQVFLKPKCDAAIAQFNPTQWRLERGQIILMSKAGDAWQFEADDNAQWRRVPDTADPLIMLRQ
ncbi:voltage-gated potassium channel Kch [Bradyrhizobium sp. LM3.2]